MLKKMLVEQFVTKYFPFKTALKGDFCGWQGYKKRQTFTKAVIALEINSAVVAFAVQQQADLIIVHHSFYYPHKNAKRLRGWKARLNAVILDAKIAILVLHTNYDRAEQGMNATMLREWGYNNIHLAKDNISWIAELPNPIKPLNLSLKLKQYTHKAFFTYAYCTNDVTQVQLCAGSGSSVIEEVCDQTTLFITGELKWSDWSSVVEQKQPTIVLNHSMENFFVDHLLDLLQQEIKDAVCLPFLVANLQQYFFDAQQKQ